MAVNPKSLENLRKFPKGTSGNPEGGRKSNKGLVKLRKATREDIEAIGYLLRNKTPTEIMEMLKKGDQSLLTSIPLSVAIQAFRKGDAGAMEKLFNEIVGKAKERIEISGVDGGPIRFQDMSEEDLAAEEERLKRLLADAKSAD